MATKKPSLNIDIDFAALQQRLQSQFRGLDVKNPSTWPVVPRYGLLLLITVAVVAALWFAWLTNFEDDLQKEKTTEQTLREDFKKKLVQAVNLEALKKQREQVLQYVNQLEKQLPGKAEMDALLSDINFAGLGRNLQFELFRPGQVLVKDYYAELPITVRVTGRYHDIGAFASDIANLSRIVTLNNIAVLPVKEGALALEATAKTFRYLDDEERASQQKAAVKPGATKPAAAAAGAKK